MANILALIAATLVLLLIPGPNVAIIVASSLRDGLRYGLITAFGTTAGLALQLMLVVAGMATVIEMAASALIWIKWAGVIYLVYLGIQTWRDVQDDLEAMGQRSQAVTFWRGFGLAVVNPKTLLFNAAFLPQFVASEPGATGQLWMVAGIYLTVIVIGDSMWAIFAASARKWLKKYGKIRNKLTGGLLVGSGFGLALSRQTL
ncbi:MAG: LysE family translocator [Woeseiaceae bacterium]